MFVRLSVRKNASKLSTRMYISQQPRRYLRLSRVPTHFLENQGMSSNSVLTGMSGNRQGIMLLLNLLMKH